MDGGGDTYISGYNQYALTNPCNIQISVYRTERYLMAEHFWHFFLQDMILKLKKK